MLILFLGRSKELSITELPVMMVLNGLHSGKHDYLFTSISEISYTMTGSWIDKRNNDRRLYNGIKDALSILAERKIITILDQNGDNYIISNEGLEVNSNKVKFVAVELWEMQKIFSESNKPFNVFTFYVNLIGTINNKTKEWHMSQDDMAALWGASKRTVNDYLDQLEKMQLIYVYRHKKRRTNGTYYKLNNSYGRYCDKEAVIAEALKYSDIVECEDFIEKLDRRAIKLRYNAYCDGAKKYKDNLSAVIALYRECVAYNKSLKYKPVEGYYDGEYKQGELLDLSVFPDEVRNEVDDNWGESIDFSVEEMLNIPIMGEVSSEPNLTNTDCVGYADLCKVESPKNSETPKQDIEVYKTGDCIESDYIESNNFTPNVRLGELKISTNKGQNPNNSDIADNESHDKSNHGIFCVTGKDSGYIDIEDLY